MKSHEPASHLEAFSDLPHDSINQTGSTIRAKKRGLSRFTFFLPLAAIPLIYVGIQYYQQPDRSLHPFPASAYLQDDKSLIGGIYSAHLEVVAYLGSKDGVGRLFAFRVKDQPECVPVLVPDKYASLPFSKGEVYFATLHVNDQGVIYADYFNKD